MSTHKLNSEAAAFLLVVDGAASARAELARVLRSSGYAVLEAATATEALDRLESDSIDLVLTALRIQPMGGLELLRTVRKTLDIPCVLYGSRVDGERLSEAGAVGVFLEEPVRNTDQLLPVVSSLVGSTCSASEARWGADRLMGSSPAMRRLRTTLRRIARSNATVLIQGETGTGKELAARAIHEESGRSHFVAVAVPELSQGLLESELFGHNRGAFTGAISSRSGLFEQADKGTLFLDEIGDTPLSVQVKLLRTLEERQVRPIGAASPRAIDVRIVAATNRDLAGMVREGTFREDLYYRIRGATLYVPALREHPGDVEPIARALISEIAAAAGARLNASDPSFFEALARAPWRGNVRELRAVLETVILWADHDEVLSQVHVLEALLQLSPALNSEDHVLGQRMLAAYRRNRWNQEAARRELGMTRAQWRSRFSRLGLSARALG